MLARRSLLLLCLTLALAGCKDQTARITTTSNSTYESHYSPAENLEALDSATLRAATHTIDLCAYSFTDHALADALKQAAAHGAHIRIYLDRVQTLGELKREQGRVDRDDDDVDTSDPRAVLKDLAATPGIEIRVKHSKTLMHLKSYTVDGLLLRSGSANFSPTGEKRQDNDMILTHDTAAIQRFTTNFDQLWNRPDNEDLSALTR